MADGDDRLRAGYDRWLREHAEELAEGWRQSFETSSGFETKPVYTPLDLEREGFDYERDLGLPGERPFTRGFAPGGYRQKLWGLEMYAGFGSAEEANERYRFLLEQGSTGGVSIALDLPTQIGLDPDHEMAREEVGQMGVALVLAGGHRADVRGHPAGRRRPRLHHRQLHRPDRRRLVPGPGREARRPRPRTSRSRSRTTRSRSTSPAAPSSCRSRRRSGSPSTPSSTWPRSPPTGCRSASPART